MDGSLKAFSKIASVHLRLIPHVSDVLLHFASAGKAAVWFWKSINQDLHEREQRHGVAILRLRHRRDDAWLESGSPPQPQSHDFAVEYLPK